MSNEQILARNRTNHSALPANKFTHEQLMISDPEAKFDVTSSISLILLK